MTLDVSAAQEAALVASASAGDRDAMAELYNRYFDRVYDFVHRMMRDADEAADVVQDVFLKAMSSMSSLKKSDRFRSWLFSIAHNTTLNRLEKQKRITRPVAGEGEEEPYIYQQIDPDRMVDPEAALVDGETTSLVWEAAAGLDRRQYALLDLHVRQGLDSAEIAEVLGVSKGNAYTMVSRLKSSMEESVTAYLMMRRGSKDCPELNDLIGDARIGGMTPDLRRLVTRHISQCSICSENKKRIASPLAVLGAFAMVPPPFGLKESIFQQISRPGGGPPTGDGGPGGASTQKPIIGRMAGAGSQATAFLTAILIAGREAIGNLPRTLSDRLEAMGSLPRRRLYTLLAGATIGIGGVGILGLFALLGAFSGDGDSVVLRILSTPTPTPRATMTTGLRVTENPVGATATPTTSGSATNTPRSTSGPTPVPTPGGQGAGGGGQGSVPSPAPTPGGDVLGATPGPAVPPTPGPAVPPTPGPAVPPTPAPADPPTPQPAVPPTPAPPAPPTPQPTAPPTPAPTAPPTAVPIPMEIVSFDVTRNCPEASVTIEWLVTGDPDGTVQIWRLYSGGVFSVKIFESSTPGEGVNYWDEHTDFPGNNPYWYRLDAYNSAGEQFSSEWKLAQNCIS